MVNIDEVYHRCWRRTPITAEMQLAMLLEKNSNNGGKIQHPQFNTFINYSVTLIPTESTVFA